MTLAEEVTFFNKGAILKELDALQENSYLELDVTKTRFLDYDIIEILEDFAYKAKQRNIDIKIISERGTVENPDSFIEFFKLDLKRIQKQRNMKRLKLILVLVVLFSIPKTVFLKIVIWGIG